MHNHISSLQNQAVKRMFQLQEKSRLRTKEGVFMLEGKREFMLAIQGGYELEAIYIQPDLFSVQEFKKEYPQLTLINPITISVEVYKKLAYRDSTEGILAIVRTKNTSLDELRLSKNPLLLVAEAPEKPGNIGALLRTADAAKVDAVLIANPKTDVYNPNIIRSSVGCVFTNQVVSAPAEEIHAFLIKNKITIYSAILQEAEDYHRQDYTQATAIIVGTEAVGLSPIWRTAAAKPVQIPMGGVIDSLNVSVAAGILLFEARKQRGF